MHIQDFEIRGFRSLVNVKLTNLPRVVLLFGGNGSGKSSILAALEAIFEVDPEIRTGS